MLQSRVLTVPRIWTEILRHAEISADDMDGDSPQRTRFECNIFCDSVSYVILFITYLHYYNSIILP